MSYSWAGNGLVGAQAAAPVEHHWRWIYREKLLDVYVNVKHHANGLRLSVCFNQMPPTQSFSIGDLAREFEITTRTIRFYEDRGLLAPTRVGQTRVYCSRDRVRLNLILRGKRLGFTLDEVAEMLDMYDAPEGETVQISYFVQRMRERRAVLEAQREDIENVLDELQKLETRCMAILGKASNALAERPEEPGAARRSLRVAG